MNETPERAQQGKSCPHFTADELLEVLYEALVAVMRSEKGPGSHYFEEEGDRIEVEPNFAACLQEGELSADERTRFLEHLVGCGFCANCFYEEVRDGLWDLSREPELLADLRRLINSEPE